MILFLVWWSYGANHSVTEDAFVEAHIINVAPQAVSGHLVSFFVEENDRVEKDQLLAEIDSEPYHDQVNPARRKVDAAEAELKRQKAALARLRLEIPLQIEIARRTLAAAKADEARAQTRPYAYQCGGRSWDRRGPSWSRSRDGRPAPGAAGIHAVHQPAEVGTRRGGLKTFSGCQLWIQL